MEDRSVNLGAVFAEYLVKLKTKLFHGIGAKKETVGSLLTPMSGTLGLGWMESPSSETVFMDAVHLTSTQWLKAGRFWTFANGDRSHLLELPQRTATYFRGDVSRLALHPDPLLLLNPAN
ncbi:hypothetical protein Bca101_099508 [Brassica carinata]